MPTASKHRQTGICNIDTTTLGGFGIV